MSKGMGTPTPSHVLTHRLRLMADVGGVLTKDRVKTVIEAADRIEQMADEITRLAERHDTSLDSSMFP